jgi:hypothetical protein
MFLAALTLKRKLENDRLDRIKCISFLQNFSRPLFNIAFCNCPRGGNRQPFSAHCAGG